MGSARVQYELERTLPALQIAAQYGIFDKDTEIRAITHKRRSFENALVRRHAIVGDVHRYLDYEQDLFELLQLRIKRVSDVEEVPRQDVHTLLHQSKAHIISIFERGVKRIRHDVDLWIRYMRWAMRQKMRSAVSRISARALALFPASISLWLMVSDYELNQNLNVFSARALLLRALRLNNIPHSYSIEASVQQRPAKKTKGRNGVAAAAVQTDMRIRPTGNEEHDTPTLEIAPNVVETMNLWLQYIRMELVFLERIRRRRHVLNIDDNDEESHQSTDEEEEVTKDEVDEQAVLEGDEEAVPAIPIAQIANEELETQTNTEQVDSSIVLGAIPIAAIKSAISLDSPTSLPPPAHFGFLMAITKLCSSFPFYGSAGALLEQLYECVANSLKLRFPDNHVALVFAQGLRTIDAAQEEAVARLTADKLNNELETSRRLRDKSSLVSTSAEVLDVLGIGKRSHGKAQEITLHAAVHQILGALEGQQQSVAATSIHKLLNNVHSNVLALQAPTAAHILAQIELVRALQAWSDSNKMGTDFDAFLEACKDRVWKDAKRRNVKGSGMERTKTLEELRATIDRSDPVDYLANALRCYDEYGQDEAFLRLAIENSSHGVVSEKFELSSSLRAWHRALSRRQEQDVSVWAAWCEFLDTCEEKFGREKVDKKGRLKKAFEERSNGDAAVSSFLSRRIVESEETIEGIRTLLSLSNRTGLAGVILLRQLTERANVLLNRTSKATELGRVLLDVFVDLSKKTNLPEDHAHSLRFQLLTLKETKETIQRYQEISQTLRRSNAEAYVELERIWQEILAELRDQGALEEEGEEESSEGESS